MDFGWGTPVNRHKGSCGIWDGFAAKIDVSALKGLFRNGFETGDRTVWSTEVS